MQPEEIQLLVIALSIVFLTLLVFLFVIFFYFQRKKTAFLIEKMESELHFRSELVKTQIEIKDQTLSEISKELHDNIGQILSVAIMQVNVIANYGEKKIDKSEWQELKEILAKSLDEIRILSKIINRDNLAQLDFLDAMQLDFDRIGKLRGIPCTLTVKGNRPPINNEHELILYRIFQEAVHNILRHSDSETIDMEVESGPTGIIVKLIDKGIGFRPEEKNSGLGLHNMQLRARLIGAAFDIQSGENGTTIQLNYPVAEKDE